MLAIVCGKEVDLPDPKDKQAVFDYVLNHLKTQGCRSLKKDHRGVLMDTCMYRGQDCRSCAVGCLIPDNEYDPFFENQVVNCGGRIDQYLKGKGYNLIFLRSLQSLHDSESWDNESRIIEIKREYLN